MFALSIILGMLVGVPREFSKLTIVSEKMKNEGGLDAGYLRFVLLRHELPPESGQPSHWDLMFEQQHTEMLLTLQLLNLPQHTVASRPQVLPAKRIADHRPLYLDYEGQVSHGRGRVAQVASGFYRQSNASPRDNRYDLMSTRLKASILLSRFELGGDITLCIERWQTSTD